MIIRNPDLSEMRVWVTLPDKPPRPVKVIAEDEENLQWILEEGEDGN